MIMAVPSYSSFFTGSASVAGALVGLLYVALTVAPENRDARVSALEHRAIGATAFTALVDALFVSLAGLIPGNALPVTSLVLGLLGLTSTAGLTVRLWRSRSTGQLSRRWPYLLCFILAVYAAQAATALVAGTASAAQAQGARFVLILFAIGIARSWELLGRRGGGLLDLLSAHRDDEEQTG